MTFASTPYDGTHPALDPGEDWRDEPGAWGVLDRAISYGNYGGLGNRIMDENPGEVARRRAADPSYSEVSDPSFRDDPRYQPIDGIDEAARRHDDGYNRDAGGESWYSWDGMHNLVEDDRRLVADVGAEMDAHGGMYSEGAQQYSEGLRGFFGARVMGVDAADWMSDKAGEVGAGIAGIGSWNSLSDAGAGIADAGGWLADTGGEAWEGISGAVSTIGNLGWPGAVGAAAGFGNVAVAGAAEAAQDLWGWITD